MIKNSDAFQNAGAKSKMSIFSFSYCVKKPILSSMSKG